MPHALLISPDGRITGTDGSRPQPIASPWVEVTAETYAAAQAMAYPRWTGTELVNDPPAPPTIDQLRSEALARYQSAAAENIRRNVPSPWDVLRDVATQEFREWADAYLALVAAELARLEEAVSGAQTPQALAAIVADWPEVTP